MVTTELEAVEERLKSFTGQLQSECGILERLVYKHKNQHRRSTYFQYILKVRRDLKLLKLAKLEEILDSSFLVFNDNRPKQKLQLLESLKRKRSDNEKYNFLDRLLGVTRLLSQMVEPLLKSAMEISTLLARSFFMKFSLTILAVLARIRVLVQQMLVDAVHLYNTVYSLSQKEQTVKLNQEGFEVFREYYPKKEETIVILECVWQTDKYVLVERMGEIEAKTLEKDDEEDASGKRPKIQYDNIEVLLGVEESSGAIDTEHITTSTNICERNDHEHVKDASDTTETSSSAIVISKKDATITDSPEVEVTETIFRSLDVESLGNAGLPSNSGTSTLKLKRETKKKVAFVSVKAPATSIVNQSWIDLKGGIEQSGGDKKDPFFSLLTGGIENNSLL